MTRTRYASLHVIVIAASALMLLPLNASSQALDQGARIRLTQAGGARHEGTLHVIGADSARITKASGALVAVSLADVERLEVSLGRRRQFWKHLGMTAFGLALAGGSVAASTYEPCDQETLFGCLMEPASRGEAFLWGSMVGGMVGVPAGIVVGAAVRREEWAPVSHPGIQPRQVSVRPTFGRGVGFAATVAYE